MGKHREITTDLYELGLLYGDTLTYLNDHNIKATVIGNNKVKYKNSEYTLSGITNMLKNGCSKRRTHNGWNYWLFNDMIISDRRKLYNKHKTMLRMREITYSKT